MNEDRLSAAQIDFLAGTVAGIAGLTVGHPLDTLKVRLQHQPPSSSSRSALYTLRQIVKAERIHGLFKGITSPILGVAAINASVFTLYGIGIRAQLRHTQDIPSLAQVAVAGSLSGIGTSFLTCPIERIKIIQQASTTLHQPSTYAVVRRILQSYGFAGLYRGLSATMLRDLGYGPYFYAYYGIIRLLSPRMAVPTPSDSVAASSLSETAATSTSTLLVAGGVAGIVGWASTYPLDSIKTRIQASDAQAFTTRSSAPSRPVSTLATIRTSLASSGNRRSLLAGLGPTLLRAVPVNMVTFGAYELVLSSFR
ncbi:hypothetical protein E5Q_01630 [Mixia osmundae IAM 14324]|uniref:Uncharacterized protein n=1 Tax=Mixia osmundae (strain CBS 9802 / IAM 14324 / JCM 22182 / KY 12970) TaxID=764103 RepID=G7DWL5_MIXOS|nr:hypothetical protein E5Q_01630 [Mixia osmundae IAM 14324]